MDEASKKKLERLVFLKLALYAPIPVTPNFGTTGTLKDVLSKALAMAGVMGALHVGSNVLSTMAASPIGSVPNAMAQGRAFQGMLEASPSLRQADPVKVKSMFDVLYQFFPSGAAQPYTAAGIVESLVQYDRVDHKTIQDLISMQKDFSATTEGARKAPTSITQELIHAVPSLF